MSWKHKFAVSALGIAMVVTPAAAQDAAETAVILSGTGSGTAKASRSLGDSVTSSINSAEAAVRAARRGGSKSRRSHSRRGGTSAVVIGTGDPLENTDASSYTTGSGATIKVSGSFRPSRTTRCTENCDEQPAQYSEPEN